MESRTARHPYARIASDLAGTPFANVRFVEETESTNADAAARLGDRSDLGSSIVADHQTHGRGRRGRAWVAPPGTALLVTTILPRAVAATALWAIPFWTALAVHRALLRARIPTIVRWPNDLLVGTDAKLAGILCVSRVTGDSAWVACGVGINVRRPPTEAVPIEPPPAYCDDIASIDRAELLCAVLREYAASLDLLDAPARVARAWEAAAGIPGARYRILNDGAAAPFGGTALRLADGGALIVAREDGREETVSLADARALR
ncbi:MAG TPA: biotin--[acetyl-CoA-carboxylase] ligase [Candidatus Tumulicola sp.]|jgi:BirA family biotin operon repressor/biotin-[acetyl-CoA-carboxylase] ligase